ncbi:integrase [Mesorhizobium tianshanense]|uniref:Integrase n=1 Tax=Mesorhizobium tianshanense TaxID=39844 RepID=A0A562MMW9_9HYPH|nr:site-specific integrase [Mesorhizobium tianshanense]TWI21219.1 integrase [Mesorhizobium tianshanense]GLS37225.1 integrase [Mesorhizobium tianshanense]
MARGLNKLSDRNVKAQTKPGRHSDGGGLYLQVEASGSRSWVFMWKSDGKRTVMGLGAYPTVSLADAREKAEACRKAVDAGRSPLADSRKEKEPTFAECVDLFLADNKLGWRNEKHKAQWEMTLGDTYCRQLRPMRVSTIGTEHVLKALKPHWQGKAETASRLRGRIERVLAFAKAKGWRSGENPAQWRGHLDALLPKRQKLQRGHHVAMPYSQVPAFVGRLGNAEAMAARALEFLILTAGRSGEVLNARWSEIDLDPAGTGPVWAVPAERMKAGRPHEVPLSPRATTILKELAETRQNDFVFPGQRLGRPLSATAIEMLLRRLKVKPVTPHGFRSSFRDWAGDATNFPRELAEAALAHRIGDATEQAYRRSTALAKRRKLMEAWAAFLARGGAKVLEFRRAGSADAPVAG